MGGAPILLLRLAVLVAAPAQCACPLCERIGEVAGVRGEDRAVVEARFQAELVRALEGDAVQSSDLLADFVIDPAGRFADYDGGSRTTFGDPSRRFEALVRDGPRPVAVVVRLTDEFRLRNASPDSWLRMISTATTAGAAFHILAPAEQADEARRLLPRLYQEVYPRLRGTPAPPEEEIRGRVWTERPPADGMPPGPAADEGDSASTRSVRRALHDLAGALSTASAREIWLLWLVDASASMGDDRQALASEIPGLIADLDRIGKVVHMGALRFDHDVAALAPVNSPPERVREAILNPGEPGSGHERPLMAVRGAVGLLPRGGGAKAVVLVTDEGGQEPGSELEAAIAEARRCGANVFVLGREAVFGWPQAYEWDEGLQYRVPVDAGPESPGRETLQTSPLCCFPDAEGFPWPWCMRRMTLQPSTGNAWIDRYLEGAGQDYRRFHQGHDAIGAHLGFDQEVPAGFGIWAPARLASETGGRYFLLGGRSYPEEALRGYEPELVPQEEWRRRNARDPVRRAVVQVLSEIERVGAIGLGSPIHAGAAQALRAADRAEREAENWLRELARTQATEETPRRWVAHRDLLIAQLRVFQVQLEEYRQTAHGGRPEGRAPNGYFLRYSVERRTDGERRQAALEALACVRRDHPDTPWARTSELLARRLRGFQWRIYVFQGGGGGAAPESGDR